MNGSHTYVNSESILKKLASEKNRLGWRYDSGTWLSGLNAAIDIVKSDTSDDEILRFYYVDSLDDYWIGQRHDNFYYADWVDDLNTFVWSKSRYLPWGQHVTADWTAWKEHTYPSEPREIPFSDWIVGFISKHGTSILREVQK